MDRRARTSAPGKASRSGAGAATATVEIVVRSPRGVAARTKRSAPRNFGAVPAPLPNWLLRHPALLEAGVTITAETATQVSAVYGCCRLIVDSLAAAPIMVTEVQRGGIRKALHDDAAAWTLNHGATIDYAPDAPTSQAIEECLYWSTLLHGNGYAEIQRDNAGRFFALWPIEPERVQPWRDETGFYYRVSAPLSLGYTGGSYYRLEAKDCFHVRGPSLYGWVGDSIVYRAAKAIGTAQAQQVYRAAYFANGTVLSGVLTSDKNVTQTQADDAKRKWVEDHGGGPSRQHGITVMGQGLKYEPINHDAQQAMLVEAARFQVQEIARFWGVPTALLAENEAWTDLSSLYVAFYRNALCPWAERFDAEATRKLFPQRQPWREVQHDLTRLTYGSFKELVAAMRVAVDGGIWTRNEAREATGKNHVGAEGDVLVSAGTMKALEDVLDPPEPPAPAAPKMLPPGAEPDGPPDNQPAQVKTRPASLSTRDAVVAMFADAFARHARRIANHRANHKGALADADRPALRAKLVEDCASCLALAKRAVSGDARTVSLESFSDALDAGEPPEKAAERFVSGVWTEAA